MTNALPSLGNENRPVGVSMLFGLAAAVVFLAGIHYVGDIFASAFLAITLVITVRPLLNWMVSKGVPRALASTVCALIIFAFLFGLVALIGVSIAQLVQTLPQYSGRFTAVYTEGINWLASLGVNEDMITRSLSSVNVSSILGTVTSALSSIGQGSGQLVTLLIVVAFLAVDTTRIGERISWLRREQPPLLNALTDFGMRVRQYWVVSTAFGLLVAVLDAIFLSVMGIPLAFTWGVFAFVTNYIPNVGFVIGLVPPALMALLSHDVTTMVIVIIGYSAINFFFQTIIQPKFTGDAVGLNTTVTFLSLLFWVTIVGALGALMAVPLTLFFKAIFIDSSPQTQWLSVFLQAKDLPDEAEPQPVRNPLSDRGKGPTRRQRSGNGRKRGTGLKGRQH